MKMKMRMRMAKNGIEVGGKDGVCWEQENRKAHLTIRIKLENWPLVGNMGPIYKTIQIGSGPTLKLFSKSTIFGPVIH